MRQENSGVFVTLTTNGTIMNERRTRRLLDSGVHMIDISIDAFSVETYSKVRVKGDLNVTRANVLNLLSWIRQSGSSTKVVVSFIEQECNRHEANDFERFWREAGADSVVVRRLHSAAGAVIKIAKMMRNDQLNLTRRTLCLSVGAYCNQSSWLSGILPCRIGPHGSSIIDFRETTISQVWQSDFYKSLRAAHVDNNYSSHEFCGQCPDWQQTRWPDDGRGYADLIAEMKAV